MNHPMNRKGFADIVLIVFVVILVGTVGYLTFNQRSSTLPQIPAPELINNTVSASLGQQFTLKKGQIANIINTGLEVEIKAFYNSPCPSGVQCIWSGVGIGFEYRFNGEVQSGINLVQAFGYQTTIFDTDYETYANLVIEKMK